MIQANELRIGNYVNYNDGSGHDDIRQVTGINKDSITAVVKGCKFASAIKSNHLIYPIILTEEILLKCGFVRDEYEEDKFYLQYCPTDYVLELMPDGSFIVGVRHIEDILFFSWDIKYLHSLQNLFFTLTGQELNVQL